MQPLGVCIAGESAAGTRATSVSHAVARPSHQRAMVPSERAPAHRYDLIVMAASIGGVRALGDIVSQLPADFPLPIVVVQHRGEPSILDRVLAQRTALCVKDVQTGEPLEPGTVYLAPADRHVVVRADRTCALVDGPRIRHLRSSANPLFESAASVFQDGVIGVVLTGSGCDATDGVQSVRRMGGFLIAQDPLSAQNSGMPRNAIRTGAVNVVLPLAEIAPALRRLAAAGRRTPRRALSRGTETPTPTMAPDGKNAAGAAATLRA